VSNEIVCNCNVALFIQSFVTLYEQKKEKEFDDYLQERLIQAKADLRELLKETKLITYK